MSKETEINNILYLLTDSIVFKYLKKFKLPIDKVGKWWYAYTNLISRQFNGKEN